MYIFFHAANFIFRLKKALFCAIFGSYPSYPQVYPTKNRGKKVAYLRICEKFRRFTKNYFDF